MKQSEHALQYPCADLEINQRTQIADGIDGVRMSVPWALNHVNCWLLEGEQSSAGSGALTLIDTGINNSSTRNVWQTLLQNQVPKQVLITHYHPDHSGLAGWFHVQGSICLSHDQEIAVMRSIWDSSEPDYVAGFSDWYARHGLGAAHIQPLTQIGHGYRATVAPLPATVDWQTLNAGDEIHLGTRRFTVMTGRGHAPAMLMLFCAEEMLLIAADQILPRISPNISVFPSSPDQNPLASFLDSLNELLSLPADTLVLPSHGDPFLGLHERTQSLIHHHNARLDQLREVCVVPKQAAEVLSVLFARELDVQQMSFALGEAVAHLRYLVSLGELVESEESGKTVFSPG